MIFFSWHYQQYFKRYIKHSLLLNHHLLLAKQLIQRQSYQTALYLINHCLSLEPNHSHCHLMASKIYFAFQAFEQGYYHASLAYRYATHSMSTREHFIYALIKTKRLDRAIVELHKLISFQGKSIKILIQLAQIYHKSNQLEESISHYQNAFELAKEQKAAKAIDDYMLDYLLIRFKTQSSLELLNEISRYLLCFPKNPYLHAFRAKLLSKEHPNEMLFHLKKALKYGAHLHVIHRIVGLCWQKYDLKRAIFHLKKSLALEPQQYQNLYDLAEAYTLLGKKQEAITYYQAFLTHPITVEEQSLVLDKLEALNPQ
jgi:tetratricopeptide (TPR) repeat protein